MRRIARTLEISLAANSSAANQEIRDQRRAELKRIPSLAERVVATGIDRLTAYKPDVATAALSGLSQTISGHRYIGNGSFSSVYRKGREVIKVYRHTAIWDEEKRQIFMEERGEMCRQITPYLGTLVANQTFSIEQHPLGDYRVVLARQQFMDGGPLDLFATNTLQLNKDEIAGYCSRQPTGQDQLHRLVQATFDGHDTAGLVPDLNGIDNFRLVGSNEDLRLIDAEPISIEEHPLVHDHILRQAELLGAFLGEAA